MKTISLISLATQLEKLQKLIRQEVNKCNPVMNKSRSLKLFNMNPKAPCIKGLIKIHKPNFPIRPIVNWQEAPAYTLSKHLRDILIQHLQLPYSFNVKNSIALMNELNSVEMTCHTNYAPLTLKTRIQIHHNPNF
jgi:hypothetical protein